MPEREDPLVGFHFSVEIQGVVTGFFTECSGLGSEHEVIEHNVVTEQGQEIVMKIPGRLKWENITLKRGITSSMDIWDWRKMVEDGRVDEARHDGSITMFDHQLNPVARWEFKRGWPLKVTGPQPKADSNEIGVEELTIAHEYIVRVEI
ncbi:MAG: phage tail protein [Anaerolineae bacterium]